MEKDGFLRLNNMLFVSNQKIGVDYRMKLATQLVVNKKTPFGVTSGIILSEPNLYERMSVK